MTSPNSSGALGNVISRLSGLKNVSGRRRVLPGAEFLQDLEGVDNDVSGTAPTLPNFANFTSPTENMPEADMGVEATPQSYDVRANVVQPPEEDAEAFSRLGQALAQYVNPQQPEMMGQQQEMGRNIPQPISPTPEAPPIETAQVDVQEGLPPVTPSEEMEMEAPQNPMLFPEDKDKTLLQEEKAQREPGTYVELGTAEKIYNDPNASPELKSEVERIFDTKITPERVKEVEEFEKAVDAFMNKLEGVDVALNAREKSLLNKIENRNLSTSEQISMAMALIAPALVGGLLAGKAGIAGALAEGGKNLAGILSAKQKEVKEAEESLPEIALERSKIAKEKLATQKEANEIKRKIHESVPNHNLKKLFMRDGMIVNGKLVLNTGNPLLPLKSTAVRTDKDFDTFREKTMPTLADKVSVTQQGLHLLDNLQELMEASEKEKQGLQYDLIPLYDPISNAFKALIPAGRDTFIDEDGNKVKISEAYETALEQLSDMYSQSVGAAGSKTAFKTYREHFREMLPNPFTLSAVAKGRTQKGTITAQIKSVKNKFEDNIMKKLEAAGVETSPVKELFSKTEINTKNSEKSRKNNRANQAVEQVLGR